MRARPRRLQSQLMDDPRVPFAEPLPAPGWAAGRCHPAVLTGVLWATTTAVGGSVTPAGPGWAVARYLAIGAACAALMFRWRFAVVMLGVAGGSAALFSALAGHDGSYHGSALALIPVALAVYAVVATSARRLALIAVGAATVATVAGALVAAGGSDGTIVIGAPAVAAVGWLAAANGAARHGPARRWTARSRVLPTG